MVMFNNNMTWQTKRLGEICDFQNGFAFKSKLFKERGFPILRISNIQNDGISYNRLVFFDKGSYKEDFDKYQVRKGDLVIAMSGATTGKLAISNIDEVFYLNQRVGKFKPKKDLSKDYLYYFLSTRIEENLRISSGVAQPNLSTEQIRSFKIPMPLFPEQRRIVKILDEVFAGIEKTKENAEKNLQNARELFESYLQSVFKVDRDFVDIKMGDKDFLQIIDGDRGRNYPKKSDFFDDGYCLFLNTKNVRSDGLIFDTKMFITKEKDKALGKGKLKRNDVIMTTRGTIGNLGLYSDGIMYENIRINSGMLIFRTNKDKILPEYLFEVLRSGIVKKQIKEHVTGAAQPQLPIKTLVNFKIPVPKSKTKQKFIVKKLDGLSEQTKKLEEIYQKKLDDLEELKKSVLKKAFSGEL